MTAVHQETFFLTGGTGFLGHYVLRDLLDLGQRVVVLLRAPLGESRVRLERLLGELECDVAAHHEAGRLRYVEGSLPDQLPDRVDRVSGVINCAASLELFSNGSGDPMRTNVEGTRRLIEWADRQEVGRFFAVSTAYTCGWNSGAILEQFHRPQPEFQTDYERSKWQAEMLLSDWSARPGRQLTLFRPSFLIGDSRTGYTSQFAGFYQFARLVSVLKKQYFNPNNGVRTHIPLRIPGRPQDRQNIVPVDFVSRMIAEVVVRPRFHGRIYHLTNPEPPTNDMMKRCYEDYFGLEGGYFAEPQEVIGQCSAAESLLWDRYHLLTPRVVHTPRFDMSNTRAAMAAVGIEFPEVDPQRVFMLFDYAAARDWGRKNGGK